MSLNGVGWRQGAAEFLLGLEDVDALATALKNGTITPAQFARIARAVLNTRAIGTTAPLTGGGDLSADRTFAISAASSGAPGSLAAADFTKLATVPTGCQLFCAYTSVEVDFGATPTGITIVPAAPGYVIDAVVVNFIATAAAGTFSTGALVKAGNNVDRNNFIAQQSATAMSAAQHAAAVSVGVPGKATFASVYGYGQSVGAGAAPLADLTSPILLDVLTAATGTGGFAYRGKVVTQFSLVPYP